ncbi:larval cuticle protein LCP-30-like [Zerene cesonia]|uniref:larval cuticle protein LCP-30-like n=1 Tax=Zerene cesonia TaxID=33412 RepID=UPI0018E529DA|nr:larval cuticle protein LCP-30-like [Zerene cesonia]
MKCFVAIVFTAFISSTLAVDDGKYHPERYGKEGKYQPSNDGQYYDYVHKYNNFYGKNIYNPAYYPLYYNSIRPYQELVAPFVKSDFPTQVVVTARPPIVTSTAVPLVPSTVKYVPLYATNQYLNGRNARIVTQDSDSNENGYHYSFQTENGISAEETGSVASASNGAARVKGFYEYVGDNGLTYRVDYTADENGFHPSGAHLP